MKTIFFIHNVVKVGCFDKDFEFYGKSKEPFLMFYTKRERSRF